MAAMKVSERFACRVTGQHRTTQRHRPRNHTQVDRDAALRAWLRQWAKEPPRWGSAAPTTPPGPRAGWSTTNASNGYGAMKAWGCRSTAAGNVSARPPRRIRRWRMRRTGPPVAGDVDIDAGHWSLSDEVVGVFTHEHEIGKASVQRFVRSSDSWPPWCAGPVRDCSALTPPRDVPSHESAITRETP